jgi:hypothetical protein
MMALWQAHNKKEEFDAARPSSSGARSGKSLEGQQVSAGNRNGADRYPNITVAFLI